MLASPSFLVLASSPFHHIQTQSQPHIKSYYVVFQMIDSINSTPVDDSNPNYIIGIAISSAKYSIQKPDSMPYAAYPFRASIISLRVHFSMP
jgi:hypothetical protein